MTAIAEKLSSNQMHDLVLYMEKQIKPLVFDKSFPYYNGTIFEFDQKSARPIGFIGPLQHVLLPNSLQRRIMWLASLHLSFEECVALMETLPGVDIAERVDAKESITFIVDGIPRVMRKDCFDFAMRKDEYYLMAAGKCELFDAIRCAAFNRKSILFPKDDDNLIVYSSLLRKMGYREVQNVEIGDLVVYFCEPFSEENMRTFRDSNPSHYGRVIGVRGDRVIVESRIDSCIIHHELEHMLYPYGNSYLLYSKRAL